MAFKLKKTSDNLFHKVSESKLDGGKVTQQPQVNMEAPSSPAKSILPIGTGVAAAYTLGKAVVKKGKEIYSDYQSGKSAREKEQSAKPKVETKTNVKPNAGETKPKPKADPYSKAAKKDSKLGDYVAKRKTLKKGSAEWNANQNKINKATVLKSVMMKLLNQRQHQHQKENHLTSCKLLLLTLRKIRWLLKKRHQKKLVT